MLKPWSRAVFTSEVMLAGVNSEDRVTQRARISVAGAASPGRTRRASAKPDGMAAHTLHSIPDAITARRSQVTTPPESILSLSM